MKDKLKKHLLPNLPYLFFVYLFDKLCQAVRLTPGLDVSEKLLHIGQGFQTAFASSAPSLHVLDICVGILGAVLVRLAVYVKSKYAKKYRKGIEYGSARWGTAADIAPYVDPVPDWNIPLTRTESLTMTSRPKQPKYARNKNILVIGGSGSGKTRFFVKPSIMQMHSSYVITDPKGQLLKETGKMLLHGAPKLDENGKPVRLEAVVISTQHDAKVTQEQIHEDVRKHVIDAVIDPAMVDENTRIYINPTGRFVIGGPQGDAGLTGRKIIVDTYGGVARHGGGAFSGKDCTKVDRSAAYAARYVAKNLVAAGVADRMEIQLSYAIGVAQPTSIMVDTFGTGKCSSEEIVTLIRKHFDLRPAGIIKMLDLRRPIYRQTAAYGHFGRTDVELPWEKLDKVDELKADL